MKNTFHFFLLLCVISIPWQAIAIMRAPLIGVPPSVWQYGVVGIYPFDIAFVCALIFGALSKEIRRAMFGRMILFMQQKTVTAMGVLFFVVSASSIAFSPDIVTGVIHILRITEVLLFVFMFSDVAFSWRWIAYALCIGGFAESLLAIGQWMMQSYGAYPWIGIVARSGDQLGASVVEYADERWLRAYGTFAHPNMLGFFLGGAYVAVLKLYACARSKMEQYGLLLMSAIISAGIFFTFSREVWVSLVTVGVGMGVYTLTRRKKKTERVAGISPMVVMAISQIILLVGLGIPYRHLVETRFAVAQQTRLEKKSIDERMSGVWQSVQDIRRHPLIGTGIGASTLSHARDDERNAKLGPAYAYQPVHNIFLLIATEIGIFGLCVFLYLLCARGLFLLRKGFAFSLSLFAFSIGVALFDHFLWSLPIGIIVSALFIFWPLEPLDS